MFSSKFDVFLRFGPYISSSGGQIEATSQAERAAAPTLPGAERVQRPREAHDAHLQTAQCQDSERRQDLIFLSHYGYFFQNTKKTVSLRNVELNVHIFLGDVIPPSEREDAERAFIRFYNPDDDADDDGSEVGGNRNKSSPPPPPQRYHELVEVHGQLDPLVSPSARLGFF